MYKLIIIINDKIIEEKVFDSWDDLQNYIDFVNQSKKKAIFRVETVIPFILSFD